MLTQAAKANSLNKETLTRAFELMCTARAMSDLFEEKSQITQKYVHATSRGHEAVQLALGLQLKPQDYLSAYYRDDSILLGIGMKPYELMLQLLAKKDDPFSGGRTYYCHPSLRRDDMPKIPHQSSATGMQAIPTTGIAMGIQYREKTGIAEEIAEKPVVVCSMGDGSVTEGEVAEAFQMAVLKQMPILYFIQDNEWTSPPVRKRFAPWMHQNMREDSRAWKFDRSTERISSLHTKLFAKFFNSFAPNAGLL
jgi:2-oxoisovalerate dehydrogenase E1 component